MSDPAPRESESTPDPKNSGSSKNEAGAETGPPGTADRCREDLEHFALYYFPHLCRLPFSDLHHYLFDRRREKTAAPVARRKGSIDVVLAPRGAAKSTLISLVFPLHALLYRTEEYVILLSATHRQALARLSNIRDELDGNKRLKDHFAEEVSNPASNSKSSLTINRVRIDAFSAGSELRGLTYGGWRPTWIILDDVESGARALSADYREDLDRWMREVIENLGNGYTNIDLIGTLLHSDALPARLSRRPDVRAKAFRSILAEAEAHELWGEWRARLADLSDPDRLASALKFFKSREAEMMAGARVLWPEKESYYDLQLMRAARGAAAFNKEKQNEPPKEGESLLPLGRAPRFHLQSRSIVLFPPRGELRAESPAFAASLDQLRIFGFLDPALGEELGGAGECDFAAIVTVGIDAAGYLYVLDAWLDRAPPSVQIPRIFDLHSRWNYSEFGVEANAFQKFLLEPIETERRARVKAGRPAPNSIRAVRHSTNKQTRILGLEALMQSGWLLFCRDLPEEFFRQMEDFPRARHDDAPDALQAAVALARAHAAKRDWSPGRALPGRRTVRNF